MRSGVAKAIRDKWPEVYTSYAKTHESQNNRLFLGQVIPVKVSERLFIMNIVGQDNYGYDGKMYTSYSAIDVGLQNMIKRIETESWLNAPLVLHTPLIGCGLGGADWDKMKDIIQESINGRMEINLWEL